MSELNELEQDVGCPHRGSVDERKAPRPIHHGLARVGNGPAPKAFRVGGFGLARQVLRSDGTRQAGFKANLVERFGMPNPPVLFQEGEQHRRQRTATARFFAPKTVNTRYRTLMHRLADEMVGRLRKNGRGDLSEMSFEMAVAVAAEIVGLTDSTRTGMAGRLNRFFAFGAGSEKGWLRSAASFLRGQYLLLQFYRHDVRPAIAARRAEPREDVISHLIGEGYANREILTECLTYGAAGMATTREFIVMAAWHLFENDELRARFLDADDAGRTTILEELLRLEPVVGELYRRTERDLAFHDGTTELIPAGSLVTIDIASANSDEAFVGACPYQALPERNDTGGPKGPGAAMSFGDGPHRCPGGTVALVETAIFLERLLTVPGIRLERPPTVTFNPLLASYELRDAIVSTDARQ